MRWRSPDPQRASRRDGDPSRSPPHHTKAACRQIRPIADEGAAFAPTRHIPTAPRSGARAPRMFSRARRRSRRACRSRATAYRRESKARHRPTCHSRKFDSRTSPEVRMSRSSGGRLSAVLEQLRPRSPAAVIGPISAAFGERARAHQLVLRAIVERDHRQRRAPAVVRASAPAPRRSARDHDRVIEARDSRRSR
jgi:hypothetical protein